MIHNLDSSGKIDCNTACFERALKASKATHVLSFNSRGSRKGGGVGEFSLIQNKEPIFQEESLLGRRELGNEMKFTYRVMIDSGFRKQGPQR